MAHRPRASPVFVPRIYYGQLLRVFQVYIPSMPQLCINAETIVFALIQQCTIVSYSTELNIPYYRQLGTTEVVDLHVLQCAVGQIFDHNQWAIIDRRGVLTNLDYIGDEDETDNDGK
jgi:hypothetical protein